jgi:hypothetical protein
MAAPGMRVLAAVLLAIAFAASPAYADEGVGVVVTGDTTLQPKLAAHLQRWLEKHGHTLSEETLSADAVATIDNCFVVGDPGCARGVVEARAKTASVVYAHVETDKSGKNVTLTAYWFVKGHEPIGERRGCEKCSTDAWRGVADTMMDVLASGSPMEHGRLKLNSHPTGMIVLLDNTQIGVTPLERDLPVGHHKVKLVHAGREVGSREIEIASGETQHVVIKAKLTRDSDDDGGGGGGSSRVGPLILLIAGGAAAGTGLGFIYVGERSGPDQKYIYPDSTPIGIGLSVVGVGAVLGGALWLAQSGHGDRQGPVVSIGTSSTYVGWLTRF